MTVKEAHAEIANHCGDIAVLFKPGAKVTVLIRNPDIAEGGADMLVTDDQPDLIIAAIQRLKERKEQKLTYEDLIGI